MEYLDQVLGGLLGIILGLIIFRLEDFVFKTYFNKERRKDIIEEVCQSSKVKWSDGNGVFETTLKDFVQRGKTLRMYMFEKKKINKFSKADDFKMFMKIKKQKSKVSILESNLKRLNGKVILEPKRRS